MPGYTCRLLNEVHLSVHESVAVGSMLHCTHCAVGDGRTLVFVCDTRSVTRTQKRVPRVWARERERERREERRGKCTHTRRAEGMSCARGTSAVSRGESRRDRDAGRDLEAKSRMCNIGTSAAQLARAGGRIARGSEKEGREAQPGRATCGVRGAHGAVLPRHQRLLQSSCLLSCSLALALTHSFSRHRPTTAGSCPLRPFTVAALLLLLPLLLLSALVPM